MKVLIAIDGSKHGAKALDYVLEHPVFFEKAELTLLHVALPMSPRTAAAAGSEILGSLYEHEHEAALGAARKRLADAGRTSKEILKIGQPVGVVIAEVADEGKYDLLVMGSHGHGPVLSALLGSTVNKVLATIHQPVLVVR